MSIKLYKNIIPFNECRTNDEPQVSCFFTETRYSLPAVIVLPGGGYCEHAAHEGVPIAEFYRSKGFHSFVLKYRLSPNTYPCALCDLQRLIKHLRANAEKLKVDPDKIFVVGFSAGGHLAALSAVSDDVCILGDDLDSFSHRPSVVILGYPVIKSDHPCIMEYCRHNEELYDELSVEKQVSHDTPQMFIWHTTDDGAVDVRSSLSLAAALKENNVKHELHIFPSGVHGLGLALCHSDISKWAQLSVDWTLNNFK